MTTVDLHLHSCFSDGLLTPEALYGLARRKHLRVIALCDHDTTEGLAPMAAQAQALTQACMPLTCLPAVEISAGSDGHTHLLGYGVHPECAPLQAAMDDLRKRRVTRGRQMVEVLARLGIHIPSDELPNPETAAMAFGRPHIARALVRIGAVRTVEQAFEQYLAEGKPAYMPLGRLTAAQAVALLTQAGAISVLAHPARLHLPAESLEALVLSLQAKGLRGLEVFHPSANRAQCKQFYAMARRLNLLITGGSDFHGDGGSRAVLGGLPAGWHTVEDDVAALMAAMAAAPFYPDAPAPASTA